MSSHIAVIQYEHNIIYTVSTTVIPTHRTHTSLPLKLLRHRLPTHPPYTFMIRLPHMPRLHILLSAIARSAYLTGVVTRLKVLGSAPVVLGLGGIAKFGRWGGIFIARAGIGAAHSGLDFVGELGSAYPLYRIFSTLLTPIVEDSVNAKCEVECMSESLGRACDVA